MAGCTFALSRTTSIQPFRNAYTINWETMYLFYTARSLGYLNKYHDNWNSQHDINYFQHNTGKPKYVQTNLQFLNHVIIIKGFLPSYICDLRWFSLFCLASLVLFSCSQRLLNSLVFSVHNEGYSIDVSFSLNLISTFIIYL